MSSRSRRWIARHPPERFGRRCLGRVVLILLATSPVAAQEALRPDRAEVTVVLDDRLGGLLETPTVDLTPLWSGPEVDPRSDAERQQVRVTDTGVVTGDVAGDRVLFGITQLPKAEMVLIRVYAAPLDGPPPEGTQPLAVQRLPLPADSHLRLLIQPGATLDEPFAMRTLPATGDPLPPLRSAAPAAVGTVVKPGAVSPPGPADASSTAPSAGAAGPEPGTPPGFGPWAVGWTALFGVLALWAVRRATSDASPGVEPWPPLAPLLLWAKLPLPPSGVLQVAVDAPHLRPLTLTLAAEIAGTGGRSTWIRVPPAEAAAWHADIRALAASPRGVPMLLALAQHTLRVEASPGPPCPAGAVELCPAPPATAPPAGALRIVLTPDPVDADLRLIPSPSAPVLEGRGGARHPLPPDLLATG